MPITDFDFDALLVVSCDLPLSYSEQALSITVRYSKARDYRSDDSLSSIAE